MGNRLPEQRWQFFTPQPEAAAQLAQTQQLSPLLAQVLLNRGIRNPTEAGIYLEPDTAHLPPPLEEFADLPKVLEILSQAITHSTHVAICGDYDADGMTSTALLLRALRWLGAKVDYAIPSRMQDGYGINRRLVEEFAAQGVGIVLTVDNGIAAYDAIARAKELGLIVIITDHHDVPDKLPPADAILNPKLIAESSPYRGIAGVGVAYILAVTLAQKLGKHRGLTKSLLELLTLGTIADLAPLTGVNRRWLRRGLAILPDSELAGIQALIQVSGVKTNQSLKPEDIGFRLGPRINAIGRIGDPQIVIDLLTTDDPGVALEKAMQCEEANQNRQRLCTQIETEAVDWCQENKASIKSDRVLVIIRPDWHHGVIGIVASRLVERYGVPVFIGTYEDETPDQLRGSARGIPEFDVYAALKYCHDLLGKYGGHHAAGGFSLAASNLELFQARLIDFAHQCLEPEHLQPMITVDVQTDFTAINEQLFHQINHFHPCGIGNEQPIFWTPNVRVLEQQNMGKDHGKFTLGQDGSKKIIRAIAWRWREYLPLPYRIDIAYKLRENTWNGKTAIELELVGVRLPNLSPLVHPQKKTRFHHQEQVYYCSLWDTLSELRIKDSQGRVLVVQKGQRQGLWGLHREQAVTVDVTQPPYYQLVKAAVKALEN